MKFKGEAPGMWCASGKMKLSKLEQPKEPLKILFNGITDDSKHFLKNIRKYNSRFQLTSFGANVIAKHFIPTFKIQGQIYHKAGSLLPFPSNDHKFL